jgi:hypothetical protein
MGCAEVISLTEVGPKPTLTLVANSSNPHSYVRVSHDKSASSSHPRQFATSVSVG